MSKHDRTTTGIVSVAAVLSAAFIAVIVLTAVDGRRTTDTAANHQTSHDRPAYLDPTEESDPPAASDAPLSTNDAPPTTTASVPPPTTPPPYTPPPTTPPPAAAGPAAFGQPWKWTDGMVVTVVSATPFQFSSYYVDDYPNSQGIAITVTFTNNSSNPVDLTTADVGLRFGSAGVTARQVFDSGANFGEPVEGILAPGQSATGSYGFAVTLGDESILSVSVQPNFDYEQALFAGSAT